MLHCKFAALVQYPDFLNMVGIRRPPFQIFTLQFTVLILIFWPTSLFILWVSSLPFSTLLGLTLEEAVLINYLFILDTTLRNTGHTIKQNLRMGRSLVKLLGIVESVTKACSCCLTLIQSPWLRLLPASMQGKWACFVSHVKWKERGSHNFLQYM